MKADEIGVLIIDDDKHFRALLQAVLEAFGVRRIAQARDGHEALSLLPNFKADIAITDMRMDPMNGIDLVLRLRHDSKSPDPFLPIIMVSAYDGKETVAAARDAGVHEFMVKPVSAKDIVSRMAHIIDNPPLFIRTKGYFGPDRRRRRHLQEWGAGSRLTAAYADWPRLEAEKTANQLN